MNIQETLSKIQFELKAKKGQKNNFGGYQYRSAEDVLEALKPLSNKYGVSVVITEKLLAEGVLESQATVTNLEGQSIAANAIVGIDMNQKGMSLPQKYGSASSYAKKYALGNLFAIDNTADADATNTHGKGSIKVTTDKAELKENSQAYLKVVTALKSKKFTLSDVEAKYLVSSELKNKLKNI
jgi:hypothetical protein